MADVKHTPEEVNAALLEALVVARDALDMAATDLSNIGEYELADHYRCKVDIASAAIALAKGEKVDG